MGLEADIAKFTDLVQSWASKTSDVFYSNVAADVTIKVIDVNGDVVDITIPNQKKMQDTFESWRATVNIKNVAGVVVADDLTPLSVDKFGGLTLAEYDALYKSYINTRTVGILPSGQSRSSQPYHFQAFVSGDNKITFLGFNDGGIFNFNGAVNAQSVMELNQPAEQQGVAITKIWAVGYHIAILYADGKLYGRGYQASGHFGIGNTSLQYQFTLMATNVADYIVSSHGDKDENPSASILKTDGSVWSAGNNGHGELGIGTTVDTYNWTITYDPANYSLEKAVKVVREGDDVGYMAVITETGKLYMAGYNGYGQLGVGDTANRSSLVLISTGTFDSSVVDVVMGGYTDAFYYGSTFVKTSSGRIYSCGYNGYGQLADGTTVNKTSFTEITYELGHDVTLDPVGDVFVQFGAMHLLTQSGNLYGVGQNNYGQLGNGSTVNQSVVQFITSNVKEFHTSIGSDAVDYPTNFIIKNDDTLWSWAYNGHGECGLDSTATVYSPTKVDFTSVDKIVGFSASGYANNCITYLHLNNGDIYACGYNGYGNVTGNTADTAYVSHFTRTHL